MNKKLLLTSAAILSMSAIAAPTVVSAATNDATIISGPQVKSDKTVDSSINSLTSAKQKVIIQGASSNVTTDTQQAFLNSAVPMAQKASAEYNVYTSVMLAQAILESNWGTSDKAVQGHNLFGSKVITMANQFTYLPKNGVLLKVGMQ
jgi:Muramidase (flagellum-specific)